MATLYLRMKSFIKQYRSLNPGFRSNDLCFPEWVNQVIKCHYTLHCSRLVHSTEIPLSAVHVGYVL